MHAYRMDESRLHDEEDIKRQHVNAILEDPLQYENTYSIIFLRRNKHLCLNHEI